MRSIAYSPSLVDEECLELLSPPYTCLSVELVVHLFCFIFLGILCQGQGAQTSALL